MADDDVRGVVTDANGDPVKGATVYALRTDTDPPQYIGTDTTDVSGFYNIASNFDGQVHVVAEWQNSGADFAAKSRPFVSVARVGEPEIANYLEDDFGDNTLTSRTSPDDGAYAYPDANVAGDVLIGRYRPEWNLTEGSPTATSGEAEIPPGGSTITTPSTFITGSFSLDFTPASSIGSGGLNICVISESERDPFVNNTSAYRVNPRGSGDYNLDKVVDGVGNVIIASSFSNNGGQTYASRVTRDSYGGWELLLDGTSQGTATDTFLPERNYYTLDNSANVNITADNLVVQ